MPRKAKKKVHKMPKLSMVDKLIYGILLVAILTLSFSIIFIPLFEGERIAFADETVIATEQLASFCWAIVPSFVFFIVTFVLWEMNYSERRPIFGLRNFKYGPPGWPKIYPLFMKNKPYVWVSEKQKKTRKQIAVILLVVLLLSFIPYPWAFYGRKCLYSDGSVKKYNAFNVETQNFSSGEIANVEFEAYRYRRHKSVGWHYGVRLNLTTDSGRCYIFEFGDFRKNEAENIPYWLTEMLQLKSRYSPGIITYSGQEYLEDVVSDRALTKEETRLLYQLFALE